MEARCHIILSSHLRKRKRVKWEEGGEGREEMGEMREDLDALTIFLFDKAIIFNYQGLASGSLCLKSPLLYIKPNMFLSTFIIKIVNGDFFTGIDGSDGLDENLIVSI